MGESALIEPRQYPNIPPLFGFLIAQKVTTLNELRTVYSFEDAMYMYEAVMIPRYNEWRESKAQENRAKK